MSDSGATINGNGRSELVARLRFAVLIIWWLPYGVLLLLLTNLTLEGLVVFGLIAACTSLALMLTGLYLYVFRKVRDGWFCLALAVATLPALYLLFALVEQAVSDKPFHM